MELRRGVVIGIFVFLLSFGFATAQTDFEVGSVLLKVSLTSGESVTRSVNIRSDGGGNFSFNVVSVPGVSLVRDEFELGEGGKKDLEVFFDSDGIKPGVYVGSLEIIGDDEILFLPIIYEVESEDVFFDANLDIPPVYTEIEPGSKLVAQIKIFDLTTAGGLKKGIGPVSVDVEYVVSGLDGNVLSSEEESLVIDGQIQVTKTVAFPESVTEGSYIISSIVKYKSSVGVSSQIFSIKNSKKKVPASVSFNSGNFGFLFIFFIGAFLFFGIVMLFVYLLREKDKFVIQLRRYNSSELRKIRELLSVQQRYILQRNGDVKGVKKEIDAKVRKLKEIQRERIKELKSLEKSGSNVEMKKRLKKWEREGYNVNPDKYKVKGLTVKEMKSLMKKWKKEYFRKNKEYKKRK